MEAVWTSPFPWMRKISRRLSGVLTANRCRLSGDKASGRTCPLSKSAYGEEALGELRDRLVSGAEESAVNANATRAMNAIIKPR